MQWFKKWFQEKCESPSNNNTFRGGNKCKKETSNEQSIKSGHRTPISLSRESICESSDKNVRDSSSDSCLSSSPSSIESSSSSTFTSTTTSPISVPTNINHSHQRSIPSDPIACRLRQQAKDLESFISGSVSSDHSINVGNDECERGAASSMPILLDPDEFFENPDDIRPYKEKNAFIDEYIIVDIKEVEAISRPSTKPSSCFKSTKKSSKPKPIKYQTTEFSIKIKPQPKTSYSMTSYCNDGYGLFYGTPSFSLSHFPETFCYRTFPDDLTYGYNYRSAHKRPYKRAKEETATSSRKKNSSAEILEGKVDAFEKSLKGPLLNELPKPCAKTTERFSVQKTFGLTDDGDIIVNVDHIIEEKGCGFFLSKKMSIYRSVERGDAVCETHRIGRSLLAILKEFFYQLCKCWNL